MALNVGGLIGILVFYALILAVGLWAAVKRRRETTQRLREREEAAGEKGESHIETEEVMLAGRNIGLVVGIMTMTATWVGGGYINGTAEVTLSDGLVWVHAPWCYSISLSIGGLLFAKTMRSRRYVTMLDPFQERYGSTMGGFLSIPAFLGDVFWSAAILNALGASISVVVDLDTTTSVIVSGAIAVSYTLCGGLYSVVYTDVVQLLCIFIGLWIAVPFALTHDAVGDISTTTDQWVGHWTAKKSGKWADYTLFLIFGGIPWQAYFQRVLSCRTPSQARYLSFAASFGCFIAAIPSVLIGAVAATTKWNETDYKDFNIDDDASRVMPLVLQYLTPPAVSFIGLGAVSAAVMSSADSSTLSASSMFSRNIYKLIFRPKASEREVVWVIRASILGVGVISTALALVVNSVYVLFHLCSDLVYAILFPQLLCIIYFKPANTYGSASAYVVGLILRLAGGESLIGFDPWIKYPYYDDEYGQLFPFRTFAMVCSLITLVLVSLATSYLFQNGIIPKKCDIFKCYAHGDDGKIREEKPEYGLEEREITMSEKLGANNQTKDDVDHTTHADPVLLSFSRAGQQPS